MDYLQRMIFESRIEISYEQLNFRTKKFCGLKHCPYQRLEKYKEVKVK